MADEITYEYRTVRAVRGTDSLVISKMGKDGWELVEQAEGTLLRSALVFRRPKKPLPRLLLAVVAGILVFLALVIGLGAALEEEDEPQGRSDSPAASTVAVPPSTAPTPPPATPMAPELITSQNTPEFASLLKTPDSCDSAHQDFAAKYKGRTVAFDGSVVTMAPHGDTSTRYDILLGPGDQGASTGTGPAFKYEDVNVFDLKLKPAGGNVPATVRAGDRFRFVAEVGEYKAKQCLFLLTPVSTETR
ncbi:DUF4839 domain-containing protein [Kitasatospora sp. NPDC051853]|uniref:DUF4839 domain-containing protein n=1 Tax=Kitasatospora sp. NPDC051853 TaxID=3364058 RepID=UPI00379FFF81